MQSSYLEGGDRKWSQLHWGGGTPTFPCARRDAPADGRDPQALHVCRPAASIRSKSIRARSTATTVELLGELGFNRMSVGVQDFDAGSAASGESHPEPRRETKLVIDAARASSASRDQRRPHLRPAEAERDQLQPHARPVIELARTASRSTTTRTCRACSSRSGASTRPTCRRPMPACRSCNWQSAA
jgi:hypothetical protein